MLSRSWTIWPQDYRSAREAFGAAFLAVSLALIALLSAGGSRAGGRVSDAAVTAFTQEIIQSTVSPQRAVAKAMSQAAALSFTSNTLEFLVNRRGAYRGEIRNFLQARLRG